MPLIPAHVARRWPLAAILALGACSSAPKRLPVDASVETIADAPSELRPDVAPDAPADAITDVVTDVPGTFDVGPGSDAQDTGPQNPDAGLANPDGGDAGFRVCSLTPAPTKPPPPPPVCGNAIVESGESCDPPAPLPNRDPAACLPNCQPVHPCSTCETQQTGRSCRDFPTAYAGCEALHNCLTTTFILDKAIPGSVGIVDAEYAYCNRATTAECKAGGGAGTCKLEFELAMGTRDAQVILDSMRDPTTPAGTAITNVAAGYAAPCYSATSLVCFETNPKPRWTEPTPCASGCPAPTVLSGPTCANPAAPKVWSEVFVPTSASWVPFWSAGPNDAWKQSSTRTVEHWDGTSWSPATPPWGLVQVPNWGADPANLWFKRGQFQGELAWWNGTTWRIVLSDYATNVIPVGKTGAWIVVASGRLFEWDGVAGLLHERTPAPLGQRLGVVYIGVAAANDVWAFSYSNGSSPTLAVQRWDGSAWRPQATPADMSYRVSVPWVGPGPDVWVVDPDTTYNSIVRARLWHFDGTAWSERANSAGVAGKITGASGSDLWAVGDTQGMLSHFDGTSWTRFRGVVGYTGALAPDGPGSLWVTTISDRLMHWHTDCAGAGTNTTMAVPVPAGNYDWTFDPGTNGAGAMQAFASNDVWEVESSAVRRWDGVTWNAVLDRGVCPTVPQNRLLTMWASSPNDVWVGAQNELLRWDGTSWQFVTSLPAVPADVSYEITSVFGFSRDDIWIVRKGNASGSIPMHWDGNQWTQYPIPRVRLPEGDGTGPVNVSGVWGSALNDLWAFGKVIDLEPTHPPGGAGAAFVHWDGTSWTRAGDLGSPAFRYRTVDRMWGAAANDIWAVGSGPAAAADAGAAVGRQLWHFDGSAWTIKEEKTSVRAVWGSGPADVWFATDTNVRHWDGATTTTFDPGAPPYGAGASFGAGHVWMAAGYSRIAHGVPK